MDTAPGEINSTGVPSARVLDRDRWAMTLLRRSGTALLSTIVFGQLILSVYVVGFYFRAVLVMSLGGMALSACMKLSTRVIAAGIFAATMMMWLPRLQTVRFRRMNNRKPAG